jgi:hypothetical protein
VWWSLLLSLIILTQGDLRVQLLGGWLGLSLLAALALLVLKRDMHHVQLSIVSWHYGALATAIGFVLPIQATESPIAARLVRDNIETPRLRPQS